jgi:ATP-binding cassette, subfamily B, bacterial
MHPESELTTKGRGYARRVALLVLARAFPGRLALVATFAVLTGVLPAIFAVLIAQIIQTLPVVIAEGWDASDGRRIVGLLSAVAGVLVAQEVVAVARELSVNNLYRRYDEYLLARVMGTTLRVPRLELFEHPALAAKTDRAARIARFGPGELVSGLSAQWSVRAHGFAAAVLVGTVWPLAAVVLATVWIVVGRQLQADYYRANPFWADPLRRARYLKQLALMPAWAKEVRIFGLARWLRDRFGQQWALVMHELWRGRRVDQRTMAVLLGMVTVANGVVLWLAVRAALDGSLLVGPLTVLVQGLFSMASLASNEGDVWIENGAVPVPDVLTFEQSAALYIPASTGDVSATGRPEREIRFEDVRFSYPGREPVYTGLDLRIEAGRSLAVVGLNGAGKTTLIKLLAGLEEPTAGRITVDGIDLRALDQQSWRRTVAAIFQDFVRYELSARDNVGYGAVETLHAADADVHIVEAARRAGADTLLAELPHGLDTPLSRRFEGGTDLSGGQWQRIALARAMTAVGGGARVLVLDEPTAHLDVRAEADLYDRFLDLTHGLTTIIISHRFSTVRRADRIVVLDGGRITEDGTHDELIAANGQYAHLFRTQAMRYVDMEEHGDE